MSIPQQQLLWPAEPFDPDPPFIATSETSREAAVRIRPLTSVDRQRVYEAIFHSGERGLTDAEIRQQTGLASDTARPRRCELVRGGFVRYSGGKRPSPSGRDMKVWICTSKTYGGATDA
jgi:hypothetical protein